MADIYASNWTEDDASNNTASPDGMPEGMSPSGVNNWGRAAAGAIKRYVNQQSPKTTAGTSTAYTLSYSVAPGALVDGMTHLIEFNADCGASPTLNVNSLGVTPIHYWNGAVWAVVPAGMIKSGMLAEVAYNASAGTYRIASASAPVIAQSIGTNGYSAMPGATSLIMQWGTQAIGGAGTSVAITYPVAFSAAAYTIQLTNTGSRDRAPYVFATSASGFTLVNPASDGSTSVFWLAIGPA